MFCKYCGSKLEENEGSFCKYCGAKLNENANQPTVQPVASTTKKTENPAQTYAILGLVFAFFFSLVGLIMSSIALKKYKTQTSEDGKGMAIAGLVISIISVAFYVLYFFIIIIAIATSL